MSSIKENGLFLPTKKRVGDAYITYLVEKRIGGYALTVSSSDLSEGCVSVDDIATDLSTAENIKNLLAENLVSPLHVFDVLENISA